MRQRQINKDTFVYQSINSLSNIVNFYRKKLSLGIKTRSFTLACTEKTLTIILRRKR
jgi:hypothetical protein